MSNKDRRCSVCGKIYSYCPRCQEDENKPHWYFCFCSENCKSIYEVTSNFESGQIDGLTAKEELKKLDLSKSKNFGESYKSSIKKINGFKNTTKEKNVEKTSKDVMKNIDSREDITEVVLEKEDKRKSKVLKESEEKGEMNVE